MLEKLIDLLKVTSTEHHKAFIEVNGEDKDWPTWYAEYMFKNLWFSENFSKLNIDSLAILLKNADIEHIKTSSRDWEKAYAEKICATI